MATEMEKCPKIPFWRPFFPSRRPFFGHFGRGAVFHFLSHFPRIFASGRFPILYMATSIVTPAMHGLRRRRPCEASSCLAGQKLTPHCLAAIFDSHLPSPKLPLKMPPKLPLPHKRAFFFFQNCPCGEGNCGRAPKYRTKGCSRYGHPKFAAMKRRKCCKNQGSRSRAVNR